MSNNFKKVFTALLMMLSAGVVVSQSSLTSPYSHYGLGDLNNISNTRNRTMGITGVAQRGFYNVNPINPASYTSFDSLSFVFEAGMRSNFNTLKTVNISESASTAGLDFMYFGFPVARGIRMSFGLMPFSTIGYKILDEQTDPTVGKVDYYYEGDGGLNQYYLGTGIQLHKNLSIGVNAYYLAGTINRSRLLHFPDSAAMLNTRVRDIVNISDFSFSAGIQFHKTFAGGSKFTLGLTGGYGNTLKTNKEQLAETLFGGINSGYEFFRDTISYSKDVPGTIKLPLLVSGGLLYEKPDKITVSLEGSYGFWNDYRIDGLQDSLKNNYRFNGGVEFIPDNRSISGYWQKIRYRAGVSYSLTYLNLKQIQVKDFYTSFGVGLPIKRQAATLNFGAEIGSRGTKKNNLIQENYLRFYFGVSITERWFVKRRYN